MTIYAKTDEDTRNVGRELAQKLGAGSTVLFEGTLGAGKTTMIRGVLEGLGFHGVVRSPTFNLIQTFPTDPPVMHADLYRLASTEGTGIEDYLDSHLCLIEWPQVAQDLIPQGEVWRVRIKFHDPGRDISITPPSSTAE